MAYSYKAQDRVMLRHGRVSPDAALNAEYIKPSPQGKTLVIAGVVDEWLLEKAERVDEWNRTRRLRQYQRKQRQEREAILPLRERGFSVNYIADRTGLPRHTVSKHIADYLAELRAARNSG